MPVRTFRGRTRQVLALQVTGKKSQADEIKAFVGGNFKIHRMLPYLHEGNDIWRQLYPGEFIVKDHRGEVYACSPETFEHLFEEVLGHNHISEERVQAWITADGRVMGSCPQCINDVSERNSRVLARQR